MLSGGLETVTCFRTDPVERGESTCPSRMYGGEGWAPGRGGGSAGWVSQSQGVQVSPVRPATFWGSCVMGVGSYLSAQEGSSIYSQKFKVRLFLFSGYWGKMQIWKAKSTQVPRNWHCEVPVFLNIGKTCEYSLLIEQRNHSLEGHSRLWCMRDKASGYSVFAVYSLMHLGHFNKWVDTWW